MDRTQTAPGAEETAQPEYAKRDLVQVRKHVRGWAGHVGEVVAVSTDHVRPIRVALRDGDDGLDERDFDPDELMLVRRAGER